MVFLFKACSRVRTYRRAPKCQKHPVAKAALHVRGKLSRSKGQIRSNFAALSLWPIVSQQTQTSKPIELKYGMKQQERVKFCMPQFSLDRRRGGWVSKPPKVPNFIKIAVLASIFCCQVRCYVPIMLKFGTKQYTVGVLSHAKFEPNRWPGGLYGCPQISTFGQIWSFQCFKPVSRPNV